MSNDEWDYFSKDPAYSTVLRDRLAAGLEMDSAKALANYLEQACDGDLSITDFGAGPGHYYPVIRQRYTKGSLRYLGVDIDVANIQYGSEYFANDPTASFRVGSVLEPEGYVSSDTNCVISANTLPHIPTIEPILRLLSKREHIRYFVFRLLIGNECVQIKKHLKEHSFEHMFEREFQFNNIYSTAYLEHYLGASWNVRIEPDIYDSRRLDQHRIPAQEEDAFYGNRVSRSVDGMVFKGDVYMPWKFAIGSRG